MITTPTTLDLWQHLGFLDLDGYLCVFSGKRPAPGSQKLEQTRQHFIAAKHAAAWAAGWLEGESIAGREAYFSVTLWQDRNRNRKNGAKPAKVRALWADGDGAVIPPGFPQPTAVVMSSPGRPHLYWALDEEQDAEQAEQLCKRIAYAIGADKGGWDIGQMLRPIGTRNYKYDGAPETTALYIRDEAYRFADLDRMIPPLPAGAETAGSGAGEPTTAGEPPFPMSGYAAEVWAGKRPTLKEDGSIDKSDSFWHLACELHDAGASAWLIRQVLIERDEALGWGHLAEKPADLERVLGKLATKPRRPRPCHHAGHQGAGDCGHEAIIETQKAALATRDAELAELRAEKYQILSTLSGPMTADAARAAIITTYEAHTSSTAPAPHHFRPGEQPDPTLRFVNVPTLAGRARVSEDTVSKVVKALADPDRPTGIRKRYFHLRSAPWAGEGMEPSPEPHKYLALAPTGGSFAASLADINSNPPEALLYKKRTVKPKPETAPALEPVVITCREHPHAGTHTTYETGAVTRCELDDYALWIVLDHTNERLVSLDAAPRPFVTGEGDAAPPVGGFFTPARSGCGEAGTPRAAVLERTRTENRYCAKDRQHRVTPHRFERGEWVCVSCAKVAGIADAAGGGG